jgi:hypothetical protein
VKPVHQGLETYPSIQPICILSRIHDISVVYACKQASKQWRQCHPKTYPSQSPYQRETQGRRQWRCRICVLSRKGVCRRDGGTAHRNVSRIAIPHQGSIGDSRSSLSLPLDCVLLPRLKDHTAPLAFHVSQGLEGKQGPLAAESCMAHSPCRQGPSVLLLGGWHGSCGPMRYLHIDKDEREQERASEKQGKRGLPRGCLDCLAQCQ